MVTPMITQSFTYQYKNQNINVTLEFPTQTDSKAKQEFVARLKEIYLRKIEMESMQEKTI